ncbi:MAG: hypothetical protein ACYS3S_22135 [Planctomycetota bacterium]
MELRSKGLFVNFSYKAAKLAKQLKLASGNKLVIKNMATGEQEEVNYDEFLSGLESG